MNSINAQLRDAYVTLLTGINLSGVVVPIYYQQAPTGTNPDTMVLIASIYSSGFNDMDTNYLRTSVQLQVVTKREQNNSGADADDLAGQIFQRVYPGTRGQVVQISSVGKVITTTLVTDIIQGGLTDGQKQIINRNITFQHQIELF
jgi:hypothetical protein